MISYRNFHISSSLQSTSPRKPSFVSPCLTPLSHLPFSHFIERKAKGGKPHISPPYCPDTRQSTLGNHSWILHVTGATAHVLVYLPTKERDRICSPLILQALPTFICSSQTNPPEKATFLLYFPAQKSHCSTGKCKHLGQHLASCHQSLPFSGLAHTFHTSQGGVLAPSVPVSMSFPMLHHLLGTPSPVCQ